MGRDTNTDTLIPRKYAHTAPPDEASCNLTDFDQFLVLLEVVEVLELVVATGEVVSVVAGAVAHCCSRL